MTCVFLLDITLCTPYLTEIDVGGVWLEAAGDQPTNLPPDFK